MRVTLCVLDSSSIESERLCQKLRCADLTVRAQQILVTMIWGWSDLAEQVDVRGNVCEGMVQSNHDNRRRSSRNEAPCSHTTGWNFPPALRVLVRTLGPLQKFLSTVRSVGLRVCSLQ